MSAQVRLTLTEEAWQEMAAVLARVKPKVGSPPQQSDRMFIEAVLSVARTGIPWRDVPAAFGQWEANGVWRKLWDGLQADDCKLAKHLFIDRTMVRAHQHAAGARKKTRIANCAKD